MNHPIENNINHLHKSDLTAMANRFKHMSLSDSQLFLIRKLDTHGMKTDMPSSAVRSEIHCFYFIAKGESLITIGDEKYLLKENECAIIPAGQIFTVRYYNDCTGFMGGFHTNFLDTTSETDNIMRSFSFLRKWGGHKLSFDSQHGQYITNIFQRLYDEKQAADNKKILKAYLHALLVELDESHKDITETEININNKICNDFIKYIFENPNASNSIQFHADRLNITAGHLHKILKRFTGKTPLAWINEAIILEAKTLLLHTEISISGVAEKVGINDPSYFARLFKKQTGLTPASFRNELKNT